MASLSELETALRNADAAGDIEAAKAIASAISEGNVEPEKKTQQELYRENMERYNKQREGMTNAEIIASDAGFRAVSGAAAPLMGATQYLGERIADPILQGVGYDKTGLPYPGDWVTQQIKTGKELKERGLKKRGENVPFIDPYELAGGVATGSLVTKGLPAVKTLGERMLQGAGVGGTYAAAMPTTREDFDQAKLEQMATGTVFGGGLPLATSAISATGRGLGQLIRPFTKKGITKDIVELLKDRLGPQKAQTLIALAKAGDKTAGQAIAAANKGLDDDFGAAIVKLESELSRRSVSGQPLRAKYATQAGEREKVIDAIAGTEKDMAKAVSARSAGTRELKDAYMSSQSRVDASPVVNKIDDIISSNKHRDAIVKPLMKIRKKLIPGKPDKPQAADPNLPANLKYQSGLPDEYAGMETNVKNLASVVDDITDMMARKTGTGQAKFDVKALTQIKDALVGQIKQPTASPEYGAFRQAYRGYSEPINRMEVGRVLQEKLLQPTGSEAPGSYLRAVRDAPKTLKSATGFPRYKGISDVLNVDEVAGVNQVARALETQAKGKGMASSVEPILPRMEAGIEITLPNLLSRPALVANAILRGISKTKTSEYNKVASELVRNPQRLAELLSQPEGSALGRIAREIYRDIQPIVAGQMSGQAGGQ